MLSGERLAKKRNSNAQISQKIFGFTLAELLVILLISSIIMVVLAPVVRKKQTAISGNASSSAKYENILYTTSSPPSECSNSSDNTVTCNFKVPKNVRFITAFMVSGGGGGAGATNPDISAGTKVTHASASQKTFAITAGMRDVKITYLTGGGGGGGGGAWIQKPGGVPTSQADCEPYDAKYLTAAQNGGKAVCVTKYNIGDTPNGGLFVDGDIYDNNGLRANSIMSNVMVNSPAVSTTSPVKLDLKSSMRYSSTLSCGLGATPCMS